MPRPKKVGAPQPKKRSRNGCWPCKSRKVKCDEAHPSCLNCQRQGETCDYSIRLNWDGRGKKKPEGSGQIVFSSGMISSLLGTSTAGSRKESKDEIASSRASEVPNSSSIIDSSTLPGTANSEPQPQPHRSYMSQTQHAPTPAQYLSRPSAVVPLIDPTLMDSQSAAAWLYLPTPYQTLAMPDLTYTQSYERYNISANAQRLAQQPANPRVRTMKRRRTGQQLPFEMLHKKAPTLNLPIDDMMGEDEGLGMETATIDRPPKRVKCHYPQRRESNGLGPLELPPPYMVPSPYGYSVYPTNQLSIGPFGPVGTPMTPALSSTQSDDSYKSFPKLSPYTAQDSPGIRRLSQDTPDIRRLSQDTPDIRRLSQDTPDIRRLSQDTSDLRRLSVESLLSGPPGMPDQQSRSYCSRPTADAHTPRPISSGNGEPLEEMTTWGVDRGFRDLDIGKNDDTNAISGGSPIGIREHLELSIDGEGDCAPIEFGFGVQTKDTAFEKNGYYAQPVIIKIPRSFEPLPAALLDNPMNLLYFHHFISHTATLLVPHHCSSNPFQKILPQMAMLDQNLMNLLLAYSASHRARLLQQPEPATRIAIWVQDVFPNLRHALNDPTRIVSNSSLAAAIMLASLEIISPKAFGVAVPWQQHLLTARSMVRARGGVRSMYYDRSNVSRFLLHWFTYLDVLGSLIDGPMDLPSSTGKLPSPTGENSNHGWVGEYDFDDENDYQIDCLFGFTGRCITILANIAELARICDIERIDKDNNIRPQWTPSLDVVARAEKLILDLEAARTNTRVQACPHLHSAGEAAYQWDTREMAATNEAYHWAGLVHLHRRILGKPSTHPDVQRAAREICEALCKVRKGSSAEVCLLFPMFTAGCDAQDNKQKAAIMDRFRGMEELGMSQVHKARTLMQKVWDTGKPWETLVSGEFVG